MLVHRKGAWTYGKIDAPEKTVGETADEEKPIRTSSAAAEERAVGLAEAVNRCVLIAPSRMYDKLLTEL